MFGLKFVVMMKLRGKVRYSLTGTIIFKRKRYKRDNFNNIVS